MHGTKDRGNRPTETCKPFDEVADHFHAALDALQHAWCATGTWSGCKIRLEVCNVGLEGGEVGLEGCEVELEGCKVGLKCCNTLQLMRDRIRIRIG